jgi:replicative DNA helicase
MQISELDKLIDKLDSELTGVEERKNLMEMMKLYEGDDSVIDSEEYLEALARLRGDKTILKIMSGFPTLDSITGGFWEGNVIVVSGPTKEGKTTFCQSLTINFSNDETRTLWFPFDTPGEELISRFFTPPLIYLPKKNTADKKLDWIEKKIIEGIAKFGTRAIFIDHLGMLTRATDNAANYSTELSSIMVELKQIAIRWRIVIFLNHHIRKIQADTVPMYSDLKDSSGVAQDSDMVLMIWRKKSKKDGIISHENKSVISVQTNRRTGKTGIVNLIHCGDHFEEETISIPKEATIGLEDLAKL